MPPKKKKPPPSPLIVRVIRELFGVETVSYKRHEAEILAARKKVQALRKEIFGK